MPRRRHGSNCGDRRMGWGMESRGACAHQSHTWKGRMLIKRPKIKTRGITPNTDDAIETDLVRDDDTTSIEDTYDYEGPLPPGRHRPMASMSREEAESDDPMVIDESGEEQDYYWIR